MSAAVSNQDLPRVGRRYVLFLTHDFIMGGRYNETLFILTGYELRNGKVFPLDKLSSGHPISAYKGSDEEPFLKDMRSALTKVDSSPSGFTGAEQELIKSGILDWNDEPNNSGVTYSVVITPSLPPAGTSNTILAQFSNQFRYRGKVRDVHGAQVGRWAWDVFLVSQL